MDGLSKFLEKIDDFSQIKDFMTIIQIPVVLFLAIQTYQAYKLKFNEFKLICFGWCVNGCYLIINLLAENVLRTLYIGFLLRTIADSLCMAFFIFAVIDSIETEPFSKLKQLPKSYIILAMICAAGLKLIPGSLHIIPFVHLRFIPEAFVDFTAIFLLGQFFREWGIKYEQRPFLFYITLGYALIQFLWIFQVFPVEKLFNKRIDEVGFTLGLLLKTSLLISLYILFIRILNVISKQETAFLLNKLAFTADIQDINSHIQGNKNIEDQEKMIFLSVFNECLKLLDVRLGHYCSFDQETQSLTIEFGTDDYANHLGYNFQITQGLTGQAVKLKEAQIKGKNNNSSYFKFSQEKAESTFSTVDAKVDSAIALPIFLDNEVLGTFLFESDQHDYFLDSNIEIAKALGNQASIAIKNLRQVQEIELSKTLLSSLMEIDRLMVNHSLDRDNVLEFILRESLKLVKGELGNIALKTGHDDELQIVAEATQSENKGRRYKISESITGKAVLERQMIYIPDIDLAPKDIHSLYKNFLDTKPLKCELVVPLMVGEEVLGVFNTESSKANKFTETDIKKVKGFAGQAAITIHIFQQFEQINNYKDRLDALAQIDLLILSSKESLPQTLKAILDKGMQLIKKDHAEAEILLFNKVTDGEDYLTIKKSTFQNDVDISIPLTSKSISAIAWKKKKIVYLPFIDKNESNPTGYDLKEIYFPDESEKASYFTPVWGKMKSELVLPLIVKNQVIGVLNIESAEYNDFKPDEIHILRNLTNAAAIAIHNAQQFESIKKKSRELLNSIDKDKVQMAALLGKLINHRIGNSVGFIRTILKERFDTGYYGELNERAKKDVKDMLVAANKVIGARREISEKMESLLKAKPMPINFRLIKDELIKFHANSLSSDKIRLEIYEFENLKPVWFNRELFLDIFYELMTNAIKAMPDGGQITISGEVEQHDSVIVKVKDNGCGIAEEELEKIFFEDYSKWKDDKGTGIGLYHLKTALEFFRGRIQVTSELNKGTVFIIKLPSIEASGPLNEKKNEREDSYN